MSREYCLRIDVVDDESSFRARVVDWVTKQGNAIGCYECPNDANRHYHVWLRSEKTCATIRANFKRYFPECKGNGSYSIKESEGNLQYIAKGDSESQDAVIIVNTMGISEDDIVKAKADRWSKTNELKQKDIRKKQPTFLEHVEIAWNVWMDERKAEIEKQIGKPLKPTSTLHHPDRAEIARWLVANFSTMRKLWDVGIITKYTNYFQHKCDPVFHQNVIARMVNDKY